MTTDRQKKGDKPPVPDLGRVAAETRARAAVAEASARARNTVLQAEAKARERIAEQERKMQALARLTHAGIRFEVLTRVERLASAGSGEPEWRAPGPAPTREAIAKCAYHKAERRGFEPGGETEDWLQAERELRAMLDSRSPWQT